MPEVHEGDAAACARTLSHFFVPEAGYRGAARVSLDLRVDCLADRSAVTLDELRAQLPRDDAGGLRAEDTTLVRYRTGRDGAAHASLLEPVRDAEHRVRFYVAVDVALPWIPALATALPQARGSMVAIVDAAGFIYARYPDPEQFAGRRHERNTVFMQILGTESGIVEGVGLDGIRRAYAFRRLPAANASDVLLMVGIPVHILYADVNRYVANTLLVAVVAVLLAVFMAWVASDLFVIRDVRRLLRATAQLSDGDLTTRVPAPRAGGELADLATQFNTLAQRLEERRREFVALGDSSPDAIVRVDRDLRIVWVNRTVTRWLSVGLDDLIGCTLEQARDRSGVSAGGRILEHVRRVLETERSLEVEEHIVLPGGERSIDVRIVPEPDASGAVRHLLLIARDVTARRQLENQVAQGERLDSIGKLAGSVAHDFNNLLTAIIGNAEIALRSLEPGHRVHGDVAEILDVARRASSLTRQLLSFARRQPTVRRVMDVNPFVAEVARLLRRLLGESITLELRLDPDAPRVRIDPTHLEQALVNLATNARDAMPRGGALTISTSRAIVGVAEPGADNALAPGEYLRLEVSDSGVGMPPDVRKRLFEPFFTTKGEHEGTGLGLAVTYGVIRQHGGRIDVDTAPGQGTRFQIYLPATTEVPPPGTPATNGARLPSPTGRETILLVEDQDHVRSMIARLLRSHGYSVVEARDGVDALHHCDNDALGHLHLVITDLVMPRMGGEALITRFHAGCPNLPILVITGYDERGTAHAIIERGEASALLEKPFEAEPLLRLVRELLDAAPAAGRAVTASPGGD